MELFRQSVVIMCLGMGLTFAFLYVVILAIRLTGRLVGRYESGLEQKGAGDAGAVVAAIAAAVQESRSGAESKG